MPGPPRGVWVCQLWGFRNSPPEGSQSSPGTANEETRGGPPGGGECQARGGGSLPGLTSQNRRGQDMPPQAGQLLSVIVFNKAPGLPTPLQGVGSVGGVGEPVASPGQEDPSYGPLKAVFLAAEGLCHGTVPSLGSPTGVCDEGRPWAWACWGAWGQRR